MHRQAHIFQRPFEQEPGGWGMNGGGGGIYECSRCSFAVILAVTGNMLHTQKKRKLVVQVQQHACLRSAGTADPSVRLDQQAAAQQLQLTLCPADVDQLRFLLKHTSWWAGGPGKMPLGSFSAPRWVL